MLASPFPLLLSEKELVIWSGRPLITATHFCKLLTVSEEKGDRLSSQRPSFLVLKIKPEQMKL